MLWESIERQDSMEHFREYGDSFANYPFRYYCRNCVRNFNTKIRVLKCTKCLGENIVELPSGVMNVSLSRLKSGKEPGFLEKFFRTRQVVAERADNDQNLRKKQLKSNNRIIARINQLIGRIDVFLKRPGVFFICRKQKEELPSYT
ncbi:MAG: hypothetical protein HZB65_02575 [Candidatus Aenigmarchaeota archaeon]|nr:hypothetical protein [Candidatus Aenigmarchaeota archaeon]